MTGTNVLTSKAVNILGLDDIGIQFNFTGTPTGSFEIQVSIDHVEDAEGNVTVPGNWVPLVFSSSPVASGQVGSIYLDIFGLSSPWVRGVYTNASGVGVLDGFICGKMI